MTILGGGHRLVDVGVARLRWPAAPHVPEAVVHRGAAVQLTDAWDDPIFDGGPQMYQMWGELWAVRGGVR